MSLKVKISPIGIFDMLKFKNLAKNRDDVINASNTNHLTSFGTNLKAEMLHPNQQNLIITEVSEPGKWTKTYTLMKRDKTPVAFFRAGQYLSIKFKIGESIISRPYSINSSPSLALEGKYKITVKENSEGFVAPWIFENWKVGTEVISSAPLGSFYYEALRDSDNVLALAGGSGITPFISMAHAIKDGLEDFHLTLLVGSCNQEEILFKKELDEISKSTKKVKVIYVLSEEDCERMEHGFIDSKIIKKYAREKPFSVFVCGPGPMYKFLDSELPKLKLEQKYIRREVYGAQNDPWNIPRYPKKSKDKTFDITVMQCGQKRKITASANETVLVALERAGITAHSHCRGGECGYCHSKLIKGNIITPKENDGTRAADIEFGYFHPCHSFPTSNLEIEIPSGK